MAVGTIGIVVPGLPTTGFFIIAAWCFGKSSPRFERWVLGLPTIGPMVRDYRDGLGMSRRVKRTAIATMAVAVAVSAVLIGRWTVAAGLVAVALLGAAFIVYRVPLRERVVAEREAARGPASAGRPAAITPARPRRDDGCASGRDSCG